jgi:hypothetical protein
MSVTLPPINRGTGAGGAATNISGKTFEEKTSNEARLLNAGWTRHSIPGSKGKFSYFLQSPDGANTFVSQGGLKAYAAAYWSKELFRCPDEAYISSGPLGLTLKILEKKNQTVSGSVDQKLCDGAWFKEEYAECLGNTVASVDYAFCLSKFLKEEYQSTTKKWATMRILHQRHGIAVLFGDDADYFGRLDQWIQQSKIPIQE